MGRVGSCSCGGNDCWKCCSVFDQRQTYNVALVPDAIRTYRVFENTTPICSRFGYRYACVATKRDMKLPGMDFGSEPVSCASHVIIMSLLFLSDPLSDLLITCQIAHGAHRFQLFLIICLGFKCLSAWTKSHGVSSVRAGACCVW